MYSENQCDAAHIHAVGGRLFLKPVNPHEPGLGLFGNPLYPFPPFVLAREYGSRCTAVPRHGHPQGMPFWLPVVVPYIPQLGPAELEPGQRDPSSGIGIAHGGTKPQFRIKISSNKFILINPKSYIEVCKWCNRKLVRSPNRFEIFF